MERTTALKQIAKFLGKSMGYRVDPSAPTNEQRKEAKSELNTAIAIRNEFRDAREARKQALLSADPEYQRLLAESSAASKRVDDLHSLCMHYKFTVGTSNGMFFSVKAQGDSWEEIIAKLEEKHNGRRAAKVQST